MIARISVLGGMNAKEMILQICPCMIYQGLKVIYDRNLGLNILISHIITFAAVMYFIRCCRPKPGFFEQKELISFFICTSEIFFGYHTIFLKINL